MSTKNSFNRLRLELCQQLRMPLEPLEPTELLHALFMCHFVFRPRMRHRPPIDLLRPFPADEMEAFEVSEDMSDVDNSSPELLKREKLSWTRQVIRHLPLPTTAAQRNVS